MADTTPPCPKQRMGEMGHHVTAGPPEPNGSGWWSWCICSCHANWWQPVLPPVTPSRTDRQPPTSVAGAKGGKDAEDR